MKCSVANDIMHSKSYYTQEYFLCWKVFRFETIIITAEGQIVR